MVKKGKKIRIGGEYFCVLNINLHNIKMHFTLEFATENKENDH